MIDVRCVLGGADDDAVDPSTGTSQSYSETAW